MRPLPLNAERLSSHSTASSRQMSTTGSRPCPTMATGVMRLQQRARRRMHQLYITSTYPTPETEKERSPIDFPQVRANLVTKSQSPPPHTLLHARTTPLLPGSAPLASLIRGLTAKFAATGVDNAAAQQEAGHLPGVREAADTIAKTNARRPRGELPTEARLSSFGFTADICGLCRSHAFPWAAEPAQWH